MPHLPKELIANSPSANTGTKPEVTRPIDLSSKTISDILGEVVWLMSQDSLLKGRTISSLEKDVLPAILKRQFKTFYAPSSDLPASSSTQIPPLRPVGFVAWMMTEENMAAQLIVDPSIMERSSADLWSSGQFPTLALVVAPFGGAEEMVRDAIKT